MRFLRLVLLAWECDIRACHDEKTGARKLARKNRTMRLSMSAMTSTVFDRAWAGEPQFVSRDGAQTVVVISLRSYEVAKPKKATLFETLKSCPFGGIELPCERNHEEVAFSWRSVVEPFCRNREGRAVEAN